MFHCLKDDRIRNPVVLELDPTVADIDGTFFADRNATKNGAKISSSPENIRLDVALQQNQWCVDEDLRQFFQAEVLIKRWVPPNYITGPSAELRTPTLPQTSSSGVHIMETIEE